MNFKPKLHVIVCTPTGQEGMQSCRPRFRVYCATCDEELHEATTGPGSRIQDHIYDGQWWHEEQVAQRPAEKEDRISGPLGLLKACGISIGEDRKGRRRAYAYDGCGIDGAARVIRDLVLKELGQTGPEPKAGDRFVDPRSGCSEYITDVREDAGSHWKVTYRSAGAVRFARIYKCGVPTPACLKEEPEVAVEGEE